MSKPRNAPSHIYWVEARYPGRNEGKPMGGKFTRRDSALKRRDAIREAGGTSTVHISQRLEWSEVPDVRTW